jgi:two-component system, NtrC family, response regulator HydG
VGRILIVEDNEVLREAMTEVLVDAFHTVHAVDSAEAAEQILEREIPELVLTDLRLPGQTGVELLQKLKAIDPFIEVIVLTAFGTVETAVEAMQFGAFDFLTKPVQMDHLCTKVEKALQVRGDRKALLIERERRDYLEREVREAFNDGQIIGRSAVMQKVYQTIEKVANTNSSVLITGESGTGKELVARAIHMRGERADGPFVRVSCGALAEGVLESELFGHVRGAFTGAVKQRRGRFELASGGILFLDEIADISPAVQVKLLRALQEKEFEQVGGEVTIRVDVRVIAATNHDLQDDVAQGKFRDDLFYRLHVIPIHVPPLRERRDDIPLLAEHFLTKICNEMRIQPRTLTDGAISVLGRYGWTGNVRELENAIERAVVLCEGDNVTDADFAFLSGRSGGSLPLPDGVVPLNEALGILERALIERAMEQSGGVKTDAAKLLEIKPSALYYKLEKYGLL